MNAVAIRLFNKLEGLRILEQVQDGAIMTLSKEKSDLKAIIRHLELKTLTNVYKDDPKAPGFIQEIKDLVSKRALYKKTEKLLSVSQRLYDDTSKKIESCRFWYSYADTDDIKRQNEAERYLAKFNV